MRNKDDTENGIQGDWGEPGENVLEGKGEGSVNKRYEFH